MRGSITPAVPRGETIWFEYNPPELETAKDVNWAEIGVPGSDFPLQQFVRGGLRTLTVEVYFNADFYDGAWDVRKSVRALEALAEKTEDTLAPPVCLFEWGAFQMPVVVGSVTTRYTMFDLGGAPLEATVALSLRAHREAGAELDVTRRAEPVRRAARPPAHSGRNGSGSVFAPAEEGGLAAADSLATAGNPTTETVTEGESLQSMSGRKYGTPKLWRALAAANSGLDKVRDLREGVELLVPDPRHPLGIVERVTAIPEESLAALRQAQKIGMEGAERSLLPSLEVPGT
jgi:hypothetical protein